MLPGAEGFQSTYFWPLELIAFPILQESGPLECTELRKFFSEEVARLPNTGSDGFLLSPEQSAIKTCWSIVLE
jgi:hypothetical protein